jgi:RNA polymerase sigma factor (sigma-70 family)
MREEKWMADRFEADRARLRGVAYRMLGSRSEAEDAVQEAWLRFSRADTSGVANLGGWLTTVVARVCLDMLRSRKSRREEPLEAGPVAAAGETPGPDREIEIADSIGLALLVVLETLTPAERVAFVLHDMFDLPFDEIAPIVDRSPDATRQLASRARRRVQGKQPSGEPDRDRRREVVEAFLAASRAGDFEGLMALLDPDVVFRADNRAAQFGAAAEVRGAAAVAAIYKGRAVAAKPARIGDGFGLVVLAGGQLRVAVRLEIEGDRIVAIEAVADPDTLAGIDHELWGE